MAGGERLPPGVRKAMEDALAANFSDVHVHTDDAADQAARSVDAVAFTTGKDVVFRAGSYRPGTPDGDRLIAHELGHVVEQSTGHSPPGVVQRQSVGTPVTTPLVSTPEEDMEKTLKDAGLPDLKTWLKGVRTCTFLDASPFLVHTQLADRLDRAAARLKSETPPAAGWVKGATSGLRPPAQGLHSFGLAIDFNIRADPYIFASATPSRAATGSQNDFVRGVIDRAVLLVLGRTAAVEAFDQRPAKPRPSAAAPDPAVARARASFDKLQEASDAYVAYLALAQPASRPKLDQLAAALQANDPAAPTADQWLATISADVARLSGVGRDKEWDWASGFVGLDPRLVEALVAEGLTWLGDDTIGGGRDIMHFDTRRVGPISRIYKGGTTGWVGLGGG